MFLTLTEPPGTLRNLIGFNDLNTIEDDNESSEEEFDGDSRVENDFPYEPVNPNGKAIGFRAPLYSRIFIQHSLFRAGCFVQRRAWFIILTLMTLFFFCCFGLQYVNVETDIVKLWVSEGGRLNEELKFLTTLQNQSWDRYKMDESYLLRNFEQEDSDPRLGLIPEDDAPVASYQVLIQTADPDSPDHNVLSRIDLMKHVTLLVEITQMRVLKFGRHWRLEDICFKPGSLDISNNSFAHALKPTLERLVPCVWISPIDCFFEGAKPLGPSPPIKSKNIPFGQLLHMLISDMPDEATWANLNPEQIIRQVTGTFDLGTINNFFLRSGIGTGYLQRSCIDPLDPHCPKTAPNFYNSCDAILHLERNLSNQNSTLCEFLSPFTTSDDFEKISHQPTSALDILGALFFAKQQINENKTGELSSEATCKKYRIPFLRWMASEWDKAKQRFPSNILPNFPNYGLMMKNGCNGIAKNVMNWPAEMVLGGIRQNVNNVEADALQSVILVATPTDVFRRFKDSNIFSDTNSTLSPQDWSPLIAREIIQDWARAFTNKIYNHDLNKNGHRVVHSLASNSISDMLAEFCDFNYAIILAGYLLMLVYALYSQCRFDGCCSLGVESAVGLALAGVLTVTLSSVAGLGISTWFGINFNAATTQIVPFLALGIGVDNMFMLLHSYPEVVSNVNRNELGFLLKQTGVSILISSLNNIFAFCAGTILPIPALRSFCAQTAILLSVNLVGIFLIYPAFIALDLKRRKAGRRDLAFLAYYCLCMDESVGTVQHYQHQNNDDNGATHQKFVNTTSDYECASPPYLPADLGKTVSSCKHTELVYTRPKFNNIQQFKRTRTRKQREPMYTLQGFLHIVYIPLLKYTTFKLSDILPENSAPADFLKTRDRYFSFYPMSIVLHGEQIDFPGRQHQIDLLRNEIGHSRFVVKLADGEPSERYWLQLFRDWLIGMQQRLDNAKLQFGDLNSANVTSAMIGNPDLQIAFSLACSYGENYDCGRVNSVRLIDESGTINADGFYNYLYGWHEYEQMFYAVSQASFYPRLKKLRQGSPGNMKHRFFVPPAPKPLFSRIPFYLSGLHDTPTIMQMIRDIRAVSENYTRMGLVNHPEGVPFTFCLIIFNPWAAGIVTLVVLSMTVELAGFMGLAHVKLNPISAVTLITAVGIGVEFTAHVVLAFLTSLGTRHERMEQCLEHMFVPVIHGGMSTLLGIVMLAFSQFDFVFKYFFVVMFALVIIGMLNGLALLPVLLSMIGPPCEIKPVGDGAVNRLRCPSVNDRPKIKRLTASTKFYLPSSNISSLPTFHH
uniref:SSD domain-containing protein n=1 Tax=Meloidogyne hapla TaxID=6305 RepID=A0A1I8BAJ4_MELHA